MRIPFVKLHGLGNDFIVTVIGGWGGQERKRALGRETRALNWQGAHLAAQAIADTITAVGSTPESGR